MNKYYQNNDLIFDYVKKGYVKLNRVPLNQIDDLVSILDKQNPLKKNKNYLYNYEINDAAINKVKDIVNNNLSNFLENFSKFYNIEGKIRKNQN